MRDDSESIEPSDCYRTEEPVCPHCGHIIKDAWDIQFRNQLSEQYQCGACEERFDIRQNVSITYTTSKVKAWR